MVALSVYIIFVDKDKRLLERRSWGMLDEGFTLK